MVFRNTPRLNSWQTLYILELKFTEAIFLSSILLRLIFNNHIHAIINNQCELSKAKYLIKILV